ncbi:MAG: ABC transporter [Actinobacteria bacterium RBG_16_68_21]|nr:MAG: ABC transporter [Actinobacteria bacterium RBG_16_68_21]
MNALVDGRDLVKRFGSFTAVDGVSLRVEDGEVVGLLGANGAGKTTLLRILLGLLSPTAGTARLFGGSPTRAALSRVGYVPQGLGLYTDLTVAENLAFRARLFGVGAPPLPDDLEARSAEIVAGLSVGYQRRVAFLAALMHHPALLVLDEPTSGVGPLGRARLWDTIREAADGGAGVLVTTHHLEEAEECDRLVMMAAGKIAAEGSLVDIVGSLQAVEVETDDWRRGLDVLGSAGVVVGLAGSRLRVPGGDPAEVRRILEDAGVAGTVSSRPATLEEKFVSLAGH